MSACLPPAGGQTLPHLGIATPFGATFYLESDGERIVTAEFRTRKPLKPLLDPLLRDAERQVRAYLARRLRRFELPLALDGTPFQIAVWGLVANLETGELISYADVARAVGKPLAHRGVAMAMGRTPFDLLIPAHRVVGADGRIKGAGPQSMRRRLLKFEGIELPG